MEDEGNGMERKERGAKEWQEKGRGRKGKGTRGWERAGKGTTGKGEGWELKRGMGGRKSRGRGQTSQKTTENHDFYQMFLLWGSCTHRHARSGSNLARECGPVVYSSVSNFIVISVYITTLNHAKKTDVGNFGVSCTHTHRPIRAKFDTLE